MLICNSCKHIECYCYSAEYFAVIDNA